MIVMENKKENRGGESTQKREKLQSGNPRLTWSIAQA